MKIAMMAQNANLYSHQRIKEAAEARGHQLDIIKTLGCYRGEQWEEVREEELVTNTQIFRVSPQFRVYSYIVI